ncbi:modification methylase hemk precursor [Chromobacterium amazonense]|uniref:peptide chain release factor N(5)-glutamine methyltransferase n=1 Tax=Chromobacterium amazonense TaxID=1382803 RepID=A0A2S9X1L4_9NEIS|nr:HemK/PrmC family methyltransferase [Chromobacterium amazonense]PRP69612.1 modification methylase hemk precursor [Chromobacterium amazonense]
MSATRSTQSIIKQARQKLAEAGIWDVEADLNCLVDRFIERADPDRAQREFMLAVNERCRRIPLGHITGMVEFDGLPLVVGSGVFIPRPHSAVIHKWLASRHDIPPGGQVLDLCAGTGAIGMAIAKRRPDLRVTCVEHENVPYQYLERNASRLLMQGVRITPKQADIADPASLAQFERTACLVTANPPYVPSTTELLPEWGVHHPQAAIYSGADGLDIARKIIHASRALLVPAGWLVIEHGDSQAEAMRAGLRISGYAAIETIVDPEASDATGASVITIGQQPN